jgi:hypothetical protein
MGSRRRPSFSRWYKQLTSFAGRFWTGYGSRLTVFLTITLLCLILRENYPFSDFRMYSGFGRKSYVIYLADAAGRPLPTNRFGLASSTLKKIFNSIRSRQFARLGKEEMRTNDLDKIAAFGLLHYLNELPAVRARQGTVLRGVQVRRINIAWNAGRISCSTETLAQRP